MNNATIAHITGMIGIIRQALGSIEAALACDANQQLAVVTPRQPAESAGTQFLSDQEDDALSTMINGVLQDGAATEEDPLSI